MYDDPNSTHAIRLRIVTDETRNAISRCPDGPIRLVSICAGQGRDVVAALDGHSRQADVTAILLELNAENVEVAQQLAEAAGLTNVHVVQTDASLTDAYVDHVPADVLLICGLFGNMVDADIRRTILLLPSLRRPAATAIWTRHVSRTPGAWT